MSASAPSHLAWVWQFRHDGDPGRIRDTLKEHGLGIALKTHDGVNWMSRYDSTRHAVTGARKVEEFANFFENAGVPFHAWSVAKGTDASREAQIASDVLSAGARSLFIDLESHPGFWVGTRTIANRYGEELRRLQPNAWLSTSIDPRPWEIDNIPLREFSAFTNEIAPQVYWQMFSNSANVRRYVSSGELVTPGGVTPTFVLAAAMRKLGSFGLPIHPIGDGTVAADSSWTEFIEQSYGAKAWSVSVWRFGVAEPGIWRLLRDTPPRLPVPATYTVQPGDSLGLIAAKLGTSVDALVRENGISNPNLISVGQQLIVPGGSTSAVAGTPAPAAVTSSTTYTVVAGDTLGGIAARHGTTVSALVSANNLGSSSLIRTGQRLTIPGSGGASTGGGTSTAPAPTPAPAVSRTHTVTAGDTLLGIASRYGTTVDAITRANNLSGSMIRIGQTLTIPSGGGGASTPAPSSSRTHTVVSGDTLIGIAGRYGTTVDALRRANGITGSNIRIGQRLSIP